MSPAASDRFAELLPFYVNGTVSAEDRAFVEAHLADHPEARAELDWHRALQSQLRDSIPAVPETIGLAKAMRLIHGDRPTVAERIGAFFANFGMRPGYALAGVAVIALQAGIIGNLLQDARDDAAEIRSLRTEPVEEGPLLKVNFAADAKEADIRFALMSVQGQLAGGPGQLGDYFVRVPAGQQDKAAEQLQKHPTVQAVAVVPGVPPRE